MHILLLAEESIGISILRHIATSTPHKLTVMASPRRKTLSGATTWSIAEQLGIPRIPARAVKQPGFPEKMRSQEVDLLISVRSRYILSQDVICAPTLGAFNLHTGPLPVYAGINVINWAIYNGETRHGVTLHRMAADVDAGDIAYSATTEIEPDDSAAAVTKKCFRISLSLMKQLIEDVDKAPESIPSIKQDLPVRQWFAPGTPHDGFVPWNEGAARAANFVRACDYFPFDSPWGLAKSAQDGEILGILKATPTHERTDASAGYVGESSGAEVKVSAGDYWVLVREVLQAEQRMAASEVLRSGSLLTDG